MAEIIEDPLSDLMLSTHTCTPSCGCEGDFVITAARVTHWLDDFGEEFGRIALGQVDELLAKGPNVELVIDRCRAAPVGTASGWLLRWRAAIDEALRAFSLADLPTVEGAHRACELARKGVDKARRRLDEREQRVRDAARQDPRWLAAEQAVHRAWAKRPSQADESTRVKAMAEIEAAKQIMAPIEEVCRARLPEHRDAVERLRAAEIAWAVAGQRLKRARLVAAASTSTQRPTDVTSG